MGQPEVISLLKGRKQLMSAKDIQVSLDCTRASLNKQLNQLVKFGELIKVPVKTKISTYTRNVNFFRYKK